MAFLIFFQGNNNRNVSKHISLKKKHKKTSPKTGPMTKAKLDLCDFFM